MQSKYIDYFNEGKVKLLKSEFDSSEILNEVSLILHSGHLNKRNLFFFKEGKGLSLPEIKSFDVNFIKNPLSMEELTSAFFTKGYGLQLRNLQSISRYFYIESLKAFRATFSLNNFNLYMNKSQTKSFNKHADPYFSLIYFLEGKKEWQFDDETLVTEEGDILLIPKKEHHNVSTLTENSLHITSSFYSLPLDKGQELDFPIQSQTQADQIYQVMQAFFISNFSHEFQFANLFDRFEQVHQNYMFYHLSKPLLFIVGYGELGFNNREEMLSMWEKLSPTEKSLDSQIAQEVRDRFKA
tara:strand:- start:42750 stop:43640 length:891 start_codon:yes stop_codon:yes gene_type:complete